MKHCFFLSCDGRNPSGLSMTQARREVLRIVVAPEPRPASQKVGRPFKIVIMHASPYRAPRSGMKSVLISFLQRPGTTWSTVAQARRDRRNDLEDVEPSDRRFQRPRAAMTALGAERKHKFEIGASGFAPNRTPTAGPVRHQPWARRSASRSFSFFGVIVVGPPVSAGTDKSRLSSSHFLSDARLFRVVPPGPRRFPARNAQSGRRRIACRARSIAAS